MRRRIYIDPESYLSDQTDSPFLYDLDDDREFEPEWCRTGALYDDELWLQYQAAVAEVGRLHRLVVEKLRGDPLDATERALALESKALLNVHSDDGLAARHQRQDELSAAALTHAATVQQAK